MKCSDRSSLNNIRAVDRAGAAKVEAAAAAAARQQGSKAIKIDDVSKYGIN